MADLSSVTVSTRNPIPFSISGRALHHHARSSASVVKWPHCSAVPKPLLLHRPANLRPGDLQQSDRISSPLPFSSDGGQPEPFIFFSEVSNREVFPLLSSRDVRQKQESSEIDDFYANMGFAIRTLREETPFLFYKDLNYDIYRDDITFRDPRNTFTGIDNYRLIFWALRFHGRMFFKAIWVEVLRIWQPSDRVIIVRWTVRGIPRVPWEAQGLFEGTSEYKLDRSGKIYEHKVDNVALNHPPLFRTPAVLNLLSSPQCATPTPTIFERVALPTWMPFANDKGSTWDIFYWALTSTLNMQTSAYWWIWYIAS